MEGCEGFRADSLTIALDMLRHDPARPRIRARLDIDRPEIAVVDVLQRHRHHFGLAVDIDAAEELQAKARCEIFALLGAASLLKHRRRTERVVELARRPGSRMNRPRDEFPERLEILKHRAVWIVIMRGPHDRPTAPASAPAH